MNTFSKVLELKYVYKQDIEYRMAHYPSADVLKIQSINGEKFNTYNRNQVKARRILNQLYEKMIAEEKK